MTPRGYKRPAWAAAGSFANAWSWLEQKDPLRDYGYADFDRRSLLKALAAARPICIPPEQSLVIPPSSATRPHEVGEAQAALRLPFSSVYLDAGRRRIGTVLDFTVDGVIAIEDGLLVGDDGRRKSRGTMLAVFGHTKPDGFSAGRVVHIGTTVHDPTAGGFAASTVYGQSLAAALGRPREEFVEGFQMLLKESARACIGLFDWLQSFNVELVEAPLSPRQRERELKKGRQIALTVQVKQSKRYTSRSQTNGKANYSHRFETRGRYNHHFEEKADGTPNKVFAACLRKDPSRLLTVDGKPCFRFWQPPFVTGPTDKPFVPKVRVA